MRERNRKSIRLKDFDYASVGGYFITICAHQRACSLSQVVDGDSCLTSIGRVVSQHWHRIPERNPRALLDEFVVMPNHVHGLILLKDDQHRREVGGPPDVGAYKPHTEPFLYDQLACAVYTPLQRGDAHIVGANGDGEVRGPHGTKPGSTGAIVQNFKKTTTREVRKAMADPEFRLWQRNYNEHIVRDEDELNRIRDYIILNPTRWLEDPCNE